MYNFQSILVNKIIFKIKHQSHFFKKIACIFIRKKKLHVISINFVIGSLYNYFFKIIKLNTVIIL